MSLRMLAGPLGFFTAFSFGAAILNFFIKYIYKNYINKLGREKKQFVDIYRKIMKITVKYHKLFGTIAIIAVAAHFFILISSNRISLTGIIAGVVMLIIFSLGFYGAYYNKNMRGMWLKVHRILAFFLLIAILLHLL